MNAMDPVLVDHALALAAQEWQDRYVAEAPVVVKQGPRAWFVVQSILHGEKKAAEGLQEHGYETFLPMMKKEIIHHRSHKVIEREFVLFNRYVFAELPADPEQWALVRAVEEVDRVLGMDGRPQPIPYVVVERLIKAQKGGEFDETGDWQTRRFAPGTTIRVKKGPFGGFYAQVTSYDGRGAVNAVIQIFGQMTPVDFPLHMVELA